MDRRAGLGKEVIEDDVFYAMGGDLIGLAAVVILSDDDGSIGFGLVAAAMRTANEGRVQRDEVEESAQAEFGFEQLPCDL